MKLRVRYDLSRAEVLVPLPETLSRAAGRLLKRSHAYAPRAGFAFLRRAIADHLAAKWKKTVDPNEILVTAGGSFAFAISILCFTSAGDTVLLPKPSYPNFRRCVVSLGRHWREYPVDDRTGEPDWDVIAHTSPETRACVCVNPHNPLGTALSQSALARLGRMCRESRMALIQDVAFHDFVWSNTIGSSAPVHVANSVVIGSLSKALGMPGLRLGWVWTSRPSIELMAHAHWAIAMSANSFSQLLAGVALDPDFDWPTTVRNTAQNLMERAAAASERAGLQLPLPAAGLTFWIDVSTFGFEADRAANDILQGAGILVRSGRDFSSGNAFRLRVGLAPTVKDSEAAYARLADYLGRRIVQR